MADAATRTRDPTSARAAILRAAEKLFAEKGFAATSVRDVAQASGASKALIHHHFGNKEALYTAVKEAVMARYAEVQGAQLAPDAAPEQFIVEGLRTLFRFFRDNPTLVRLGAWSQLEGGGDGWPSVEQLWQTLIDRMRSAQRAGLIRDDIPAVFLLTMARALALHWWQFRAAHAELLKFFPDQNSLDEQYLEYMLEVLLRGTAGAAFPREQGPAKRPPGEEA